MIKIRALLNGNAEIMIYDPIGGDWWGNGVTAQQFVYDLEELGDVKNIKVRINSPGGEVFDGFAIYNALKNHDARVEVQIDGLAASIASVIAMAGDEVTMGVGALIMIHDPWSIALGNADDMRDQADMLDQVKVGIIDAYAARTAIDRETLNQMCTNETWLTVDEAIEQGFADKRTRVEEPDSASDLFNADWGLVMARFKTPDKFTPPEHTRGSPLSADAVAPTPLEKPMDKVNKTASAQTAEEVTKAHADGVAEGVAKALAEDKRRRADICAAFGPHAEAHNTLMAECQNDQECTVETAQKKLLAALAEDVKPLKGDVTVGADERDRFITGAANAMNARLGHVQREAGNEFNGMSLPNLAAFALNRAGISVKGLSNDGIARKVLASHSTSDFPLLLSSVAGKALRAAYEHFPDTWQAWCAVGEVSDFKASPRIQLGSFNGLALIPEGGEYDYGTFGEEAENITAVTKGKGLKLTRQMIVNDDLGGFNRRAMMMGRAAARSVNTDVYTLLTSGTSNNGPDMSDTGQLFNATAVTTAGGHANLAGTGAAPTVATISAGRAAMRKQKDVGLNETLNIMARTIVSPIALEDTIWALLNSTADPASSNSGKKNFLADVANLQLVTDPFLDGIAAGAWYLAADPMDAPLIEVAFLDGQQTPFIDDDIEWATDSLLMKVRLDYGVSAIDWRAGYRNAGA